MVGENDLVAIFHSVHKVLKAERMLKDAGVDMMTIPVPRQLSSDCGLAIRFAPKDRESVESILEKGGISPAELHCRKGSSYVRV